MLPPRRICTRLLLNNLWVICFIVKSWNYLIKNGNQVRQFVNKKNMLDRVSNSANIKTLTKKKGQRIK